MANITLAGKQKTGDRTELCLGSKDVVQLLAVYRCVDPASASDATSPPRQGGGRSRRMTGEVSDELINEAHCVQGTEVSLPNVSTDTNTVLCTRNHNPFRHGGVKRGEREKVVGWRENKHPVDRRG